MDMPKTCEKCDISECLFHGKEWFTVDEKKNYRDSRAEGCLIKCDIEDIKAEIMNERDDIACGVMAKYSSDEAYYNALGWVLNIIDKHCGKENE